MRPRVVEGLAHVLIVTENEAQICLLPNYCFLCPDITSKCHIYFKKNSSMVTQKEELLVKLVICAYFLTWLVLALRDT